MWTMTQSGFRPLQAPRLASGNRQVRQQQLSAVGTGPAGPASTHGGHDPSNSEGWRSFTTHRVQIRSLSGVSERQLGPSILDPSWAGLSNKGNFQLKKQNSTRVSDLFLTLQLRLHPHRSCPCSSRGMYACPTPPLRCSSSKFQTLLQNGDARANSTWPEGALSSSHGTSFSFSSLLPFTLSDQLPNKGGNKDNKVIQKCGAVTHITKQSVTDELLWWRETVPHLFYLSLRTDWEVLDYWQLKPPGW